MQVEKGKIITLAYTLRENNEQGPIVEEPFLSATLCFGILIGKLFKIDRTFAVLMSGNLDPGVQSWRDFVKEKIRITDDKSVNPLPSGLVIQGMQNPALVMVPTSLLGPAVC